MRRMKKKIKKVIRKKNKKRSWNGVFDKMNYSSGPGDNIYVYG